MSYSRDHIIHSSSPCVICAGEDREVIATYSRHFKPLTTVICTGCGLIHSYPIPQQRELDNYYRTHYRTDYKNTYTPKRKHIVRYSKGANERLRQLVAILSPNGQSLLDVGSGSGEFIYAASLLGFTSSGLEPHEGYSAYTRRIFGIPVITAPLESAPITPESFDIITIHHVLEHLQCPFMALSTLNRWLKLGGLLVLEVPNIETTQHSPINRFHHAHIYNFNANTLHALIEKAGFELLTQENNGGTRVFARKIMEPNSNYFRSIPANYQLLRHLMSPEIARQHYHQKRPIYRLFRKACRTISEYVMALKYPNPKHIVQNQLHQLKLK